MQWVEIIYGVAFLYNSQHTLTRLTWLIGFTLKMESVTRNTIFGLKMMVKSRLENYILKSLHELFLYLS